MASRILALVAAVAMVAGAIVVRARLDDHDERTTTTLRLVCASELAAVCDDLGADAGSRVEVRVEPAIVTADRLSGLAPGLAVPLDGWLVTAPWPAIVAATRARAAADPFLDVGDVLARSPVVLAVRPDRRDALAAACGAEPGWKCLGDEAGRPWADLPGGRVDWGRVKPGHPPVGTAAGLAVLGAATAGFYGRSADLSRADLEDGAYADWLRRLEEAVPDRTATPLLTMLQRPSLFDAVGALEAEAGPALVTARAPKPVLLYPAPVATADVVLATTAGRAGDLLAALASGTTGRRALARHGWRVDGVPAEDGIATSVRLPATSNLPPPDVLDALRAVVTQVVR